MKTAEDTRKSGEKGAERGEVATLEEAKRLVTNRVRWKAFVGALNSPTNQRSNSIESISENIMVEIPKHTDSFLGFTRS